MPGAFPFKPLDAVLLFASESTDSIDANFYYHSKTLADSSVLLWTRGGKTIICPGMNARACKSESPYPVISTRRGQKLVDLISRIVKKKNPSIGLDLENISAEKYLRLKAAMKGSKFSGVSAQLSAMRAVKTPSEISKIKKAARLSNEILEGLEFSSSMTELDVVRQLTVECAKRSLLFAYPPIVATGGNSSMPHHVPGKKKLSGIILIDFGVKYQNYCADLTRCFFIGRCEKEREKYDEAKRIFSGIVAGADGCKTAGDLAKLSDSICKKSGWPEMIHAPGHGLGLQVHEAPRLSISSQEKLSPGVVLAIEPGWYSGKFGVRFENDIAIGKNGRAAVLL